MRFEIFEMTDLNEKIIRGSGVVSYDDYKEVKQAVMHIKAAVDASGVTPGVPLSQ